MVRFGKVSEQNAGMTYRVVDGRLLDGGELCRSKVFCRVSMPSALLGSNERARAIATTRRRAVWLGDDSRLLGVSKPLRCDLGVVLDV